MDSVPVCRLERRASILHAMVITLLLALSQVPILPQRIGASTGSFVANGFWDAAIAAIKAEVGVGRRTLATIQFGHNDQKIAGPESMGKNLTSMVQQIRALGGEPVLLTSLTYAKHMTSPFLNLCLYTLCAV